MKTKILLFITFLFFLLNASAFSQETLMSCVATDVPPGNRLPSIGAVNVLVIFAQFPDDNYQTTNSIWIQGQAPSDINSWVDQTWSSNPTQGSLTHYYNEMSFDKLKFTGKTVSVISPHSRQWYLDNSKDRWYIHSEILQQLDTDPTWDFGQFDNWDASRNNTSDGIVDMIIFVWRNIGNEYSGLAKTDLYNRLDFDNDRGGLGGGYNTLYVDGGARQIVEHDLNSGVTIRDYVANGKAQTFRIVVHEFAHYLLGGNDYHSGFGFWGMLASYGVKSIVANSFERERLGWINLTNKTYTSGSSDQIGKTIGDYVTTGDAYKLVISTSPTQCFYIENHQKLNYWETHNTFGNIENGVYVLRLDNNTPSDFTYSDNAHAWLRNSGNFRCIPASGRYDWTVNQLVSNPWGSGTLPVFKNLGSDRVNGDHDLNYLSWTWGGISQNKEAIYFTEDQNGNPVQDIRYPGNGYDAFRIGYNDSFSPWSNPNDQKLDKTCTSFGFKLTNFSYNTYTLNIYNNLNEYVISQNTTLSQGVWNVSNNITVNNGVTLTLQPGTTLIFASGKSLIINGTLNSTNTTFTSSSPSTYWSGIKFYSGSQGILDGCNVNHVQAFGGYAIAITGASPTIQNCTIENNVTNCGGISVINNGSSIPYIYHNIIRNNTYHGIYIYHSTAYLRYNTISGQTTSGRAAVYCDYFSTPLFAVPAGGYEEGRNTLQNSYYGLYGGYYSNINAGAASNAYHNRFINNSYANVYASDYTTIWAQYDWWGAPYPTKFYTVNNSVIHPDNPLTSDPGPGAKIIAAENAASGELTSKVILNKVIFRKYSESSLNQKSSDDTKRDLTLLIEEYRNTRDKSIISFIKQYVDNKLDPDSIRPVAMEVLSSIYNIDNNMEEALSINELLIKDYPSTVHEKNGKMSLFFNCLDSRDYLSAMKILSSINKKYSKNDEVIVANWLMNSSSKVDVENQPEYQTENSVTEFSLSNYPNPFNPSTTISYNLPRNSSVEIEIYDILGKKVKSFTFSSQSTGMQKVIWDGTNSNNQQVSSGIYLYHFKAVSLEGNKENFEKTAKLLLMK